MASTQHRGRPSSATLDHLPESCGKASCKALLFDLGDQRVRTGEQGGSRLSGARLGTVFLPQPAAVLRKQFACPGMSHPAESSAQQLCQRGFFISKPRSHTDSQNFSLSVWKRMLSGFCFSHTPRIALAKCPIRPHRAPPATCRLCWDPQTDCLALRMVVA